MLNDIVIDTNVLLHAQNPNEKRFKDSSNLICKILDENTSLCMDEGFSEDESKNKSMIGWEYLSNLQYGSIGLNLIAQLALQQRIKQLTKRAPERIVSKINQLIRNKTDRVFLNVAYNSDEKTLVSHDYKDFQKTKRRFIATNLQIQVIEACDCLDYF